MQPSDSPAGPWVGLSLMLDDAFAREVLPLFEAGQVDALEYSFEVGWTPRGVPPWAVSLLDHYASQNRLWGHGVTYSTLSTDARGRQSKWLSRAAEETTQRRYRGVSEHYGFMGNDGADLGAPLPLPTGPGVTQTGVDALRRLSDRLNVDVGLENLALALGPRDVWDQGAAIAEILEAVDGYLVLDVHNLYCQQVNFDADALELLATYPLDRVRCIHISGGSWSDYLRGDQPARFRRDTHDDGVPEPVFALLDSALRRCSGTRAVILERLGGTLGPDSGPRHRSDFARIRDIVRGAS